MNMRIVSVILVGVAVLLIQCTDATTYTVGDGLNWIDPPSLTTYSIWASTHAFVRGDVLVFSFNTGVHNVAEVTKQAYNKCNTTSPIAIQSQSPVRIHLSNRGKRYFISTLDNDCENGLKVAINVLKQLPPPPPPGPSPAIAPVAAPKSSISAPPLSAAAPNSPAVLTPPPPSPNSATLGSTSLLSVFVSLILGFIWQFIL